MQWRRQLALVVAFLFGTTVAAAAGAYALGLATAVCTPAPPTNAQPGAQAQWLAQVEACNGVGAIWEAAITSTVVLAAVTLLGAGVLVAASVRTARAT